jgi:hypothetical protein
MHINLVFQFIENIREEGSAISVNQLQSAETKTLFITLSKYAF